MRLRPIRPKPPGYRAAQLVLAPGIAALLAFSGLFTACHTDEESSWTSPTRRFSVETQTTTTPALGAAPSRTRAAGTGSISESTPATAPAKRAAAPSTVRPSDQQEPRNFSPRSSTVPESIQSDGLTPCQRSAAACFGVGGLDSLMDNLDGLAINRDTGRFCFEFQDGCGRR